MGIVWTVLSFILIFIAIMVVYALCRMYVFTKVRINKWIPLAIAVVLFIAQIIYQSNVEVKSSAVNLGFTFVTVLFFLWFMDILQTGGPKKKDKKIVIKPKAKPNRVKNKKK